MILRDVATQQGAAKVAERMLTAFQEPFTIAEQHLIVTVSFGIALAPRDGRDSGELLGAADEAVDRAKEAGKNTFRFFSTPDATETWDESRQLGADRLRR